MYATSVLPLIFYDSLVKSVDPDARTEFVFRS